VDIIIKSVKVCPHPCGRLCKALVRGRSLLGCGKELRRGHGYLSTVNAECFQVWVSETVRSLVQRSPTECGVSVCDLENLKKEAVQVKVALIY